MFDDKPELVHGFGLSACLCFEGGQADSGGGGKAVRRFALEEVAIGRNGGIDVQVTELSGARRVPEASQFGIEPVGIQRLGHEAGQRRGIQQLTISGDLERDCPGGFERRRGLCRRGRGDGCVQDSQALGHPGEQGGGKLPGAIAGFLFGEQPILAERPSAHGGQDDHRQHDQSGLRVKGRLGTLPGHGNRNWILGDARRSGCGKLSGLCKTHRVHPGKARNPNLETRNKSEWTKIKWGRTNPLGCGMVSDFMISRFLLSFGSRISDFGFRILDFG